MELDELIEKEKVEDLKETYKQHKKYENKIELYKE